MVLFSLKMGNFALQNFEDGKRIKKNDNCARHIMFVGRIRLCISSSGKDSRRLH